MKRREMRKRTEKRQKAPGRQKRTRRCRELEHYLKIDGGESKWSGDKEMEGINEGELKQREG